MSSLIDLMMMADTISSSTSSVTSSESNIEALTCALKTLEDHPDPNLALPAEIRLLKEALLHPSDYVIELFHPEKYEKIKAERKSTGAAICKEETCGNMTCPENVEIHSRIAKRKASVPPVRSLPSERFDYEKQGLAPPPLMKNNEHMAGVPSIVLFEKVTWSVPERWPSKVQRKSHDSNDGLFANHPAITKLTESAKRTRQKRHMDQKSNIGAVFPSPSTRSLRVAQADSNSTPHQNMHKGDTKTHGELDQDVPSKVHYKNLSKPNHSFSPSLSMASPGLNLVTTFTYQPSLDITKEENQILFKRYHSCEPLYIEKANDSPLSHSDDLNITIAMSMPSSPTLEPINKTAGRQTKKSNQGSQTSSKRGGKRHQVYVDAVETIIPDNQVSALSDVEVAFCSKARVPLKVYIHAKDCLTETWNTKGPFNKTAAQKMFRMDVNKTAKIYDFLVSRGWIGHSL